MAHLRKNREWQGVAVGLLVVLLWGGPPAIAHQTQLAEDVGGTKHIEPDDTPRAGEPAVVWFALTRQGGQIIPLSQCDCQLAIYAQPRAGGDRPIQEPALRAIATEGYEGIPAADVTFPTVGAYELVLTGRPQAGESFSPFELTFTTTVATGTAPAPAVAASPAGVPSPDADTRVERDERPLTSPGVIAGTLAILGGGFLVWRSYRRRKW